MIFPAGEASALDEAGEENGLRFHRLDDLPEVDPVEGVPRIAVLAGGVNQNIWSLRELGFPADPISTSASGALNNPAGPNPLDDYDVVFNTAGWPGATSATARARLDAFFDAGGGYIGAGAAGADFLSAANSGQLPGLTPGSATAGVGQSGIFHWTNTGGLDSVIVGTYPEQDTLIMDPPTWFTAVPAEAAIDGRLLGDTTSTFASGLWLLPRPSEAASAPIAVHAESPAADSSARITAFAMNPLYRADPEREWPMVGKRRTGQASPARLQRPAPPCARTPARPSPSRRWRSRAVRSGRTPAISAAPDPLAVAGDAIPALDDDSVPP